MARRAKRKVKDEYETRSSNLQQLPLHVKCAESVVLNLETHTVRLRVVYEPEL